jgi:hypothetical protein
MNVPEENKRLVGVAVGSIVSPAGDAVVLPAGGLGGSAVHSACKLGVAYWWASWPPGYAVSLQICYGRHSTMYSSIVNPFFRPAQYFEDNT